MDATVLVSMLNKLEIVDACGREMLPPGVRDCEEMPPPIDRKESQNGGGRGGIPCAMAGLLATRNDINVALDDQRPPHEPPDLSHCYAGDRKVPKNYNEAMRSEFAHHWEDSRRREYRGLLDAGTFELV